MNKNKEQAIKKFLLSNPQICRKCMLQKLQENPKMCGCIYLENNDEQLCPKVTEDYDIFEIKLTRLEKYEKAIEIIRNKNINVDNEVVGIDSYEQYKIVFWYIHGNFQLTEEEFKLLKEVFNNASKE